MPVLPPPPPNPILSVIELMDQRKGGTDKQWFTSYERTWQVQTVDPTVGPAAVMSAVPVGISSIYATGGTYAETDAGSWVQSLDCAQFSDDGMEWRVKAVYGPYDPSVWPKDPRRHPIEVSWSFAQFSRIIDRDQNGNAVVQTAGDYFDPPVEGDDSRPTLNLVRNEATFDAALAGDFKDSINSDIFLGVFPAFTAKCANISAEHVLDPYIGWYWKVSYEFHINTDETFIRNILSQGMRQKSANGTSYAQIIINGGPITSPVPLDINGRALPPNGVPIFLAFHIQKERAFAGFNFPNLPA